MPPGRVASLAPPVPQRAGPTIRNNSGGCESSGERGTPIGSSDLYRPGEMQPVRSSRLYAPKLGPPRTSPACAPLPMPAASSPTMPSAASEI